MYANRQKTYIDMADKTFTERVIAVQSQLKAPKNQRNNGSVKKGMDGSQVTGTADHPTLENTRLNGLLAIDDSKDADALNNGKGAHGNLEGLRQGKGDCPAPGHSCSWTRRQQ